MEMAEHARIFTQLHMPVLSCHPASPWQRGINEKPNGLVRRYFLKGTDRSVHSRAHLRRIQREFNIRRRKSPGEQTPTEGLTELWVTIEPLRYDDCWKPRDARGFPIFSRR